MGADFTNLEKIIRAAQPDVDFAVWLARYAELEGHICRVEVAGVDARPLGTGFLVGPDLCMTNHHVIEEIVNGAVSPADVRLRFDYRRAADGRELHPGTVFVLARSWLVALSPPSELDLRPETNGRLPAPDELDVAVLRVAGSPGRQPVGRGATLPDGAEERGWIARVSAVATVPGDALFVVQHPAGEPLKLAAGSVLEANGNGTRLRHGVNTRPGSSGSPCFDAQLDLVAVHHAGDPLQGPPRYNAAIPVPAIRSWAARQAPAVPLFPPR
jgi:hypothetical protein